MKMIQRTSIRYNGTVAKTTGLAPWMKRAVNIFENSHFLKGVHRYY